MRKLITGVLGAIALGLATLAATTTSAGATPTCAGIGGIQNHGEHIVGDYVTGAGGIGGTDLTWPPRGGQVGEAIRGAGAEQPGAPGRHGHAPFAPGASFCVDQSQSPGVHL